MEADLVIVISKQKEKRTQRIWREYWDGSEETTVRSYKIAFGEKLQMVQGNHEMAIING